MNFVNNIDGVFTFAHEIGHSVHSYLSNKNQPQSLSHYPIVLAEIASTVNEVLLLKYFYANAKTKEEKIHFLDEYIRMFTSTIFTQTKFSEFEEYAHKYGYSVVEMFCGHGLGKVFHDEPNVLHFGRKGTGPLIKEGMFFTIEPMINIGKKFGTILSNGWTAVTKDRTLSAQFEHSLGVTKDGCEVFTYSPKGLDRPPYK